MKIGKQGYVLLATKGNAVEWSRLVRLDREREREREILDVARGVCATSGS